MNVADLPSRLRLARWSLRKLGLGIGRSDLVLDVGSGASPHPRADVLLEKHFHGQHRHGAAAVADRPIVFADACAMPFKDKTFDFVLAFHVLEHMRDPAAFLQELCRVGRAGYIETPSVLFERLVPYDVHLLEILALDDKLYLRKKPAPATDEFLQKLSVTTRLPAWRRLFYGTPELFHVRFFWQGSIPFEIVNPEEPCAWFKDAPADAPHASDELAATGWRSVGQSLLRRLYSRTRARPALRDMLVCPTCRGPLTEAAADWLACGTCRLRYPASPWPDFTQPARL